MRASARCVTGKTIDTWRRGPSPRALQEASARSVQSVWHWVDEDELFGVLDPEGVRDAAARVAMVERVWAGPVFAARAPRRD